MFQGLRFPSQASLAALPRMDINDGVHKPFFWKVNAAAPTAASATTVVNCFPFRLITAAIDGRNSLYFISATATTMSTTAITPSESASLLSNR